MRRLLVAALALLGGCAQLNVQVDVIEPQYASAAALDAGLRIEAADIELATHGPTDVFLTRAFGAYDRFKNRCIDELLVLATTARDAAAQGSVAQQIQQANIVTLNRAKDNHETQREASDELYRLDESVSREIARGPSGAMAPQSHVALSGPLRAALLQRRAKIAEIEQELRESVRGQRSGSFNCGDAAAQFAPDAATAARVTQNQQAKVPEAEQEIHQAAAQARITGEGILLNGSREAFYITSAPDRVWARRYNRAFGGGMFGSTSIAIVMNQTADFSVKGFIFDGRSVAQMVSKVGVQAISLIAAAHGAPINLRSTPAATGSPTQFDTAHLISTSRTTVEQAEAEQEAYQTALLRIAESVMTNWGGLTATTEDAAARGIVSGTLTAYRTSWQAAPRP